MSLRSTESTALFGGIAGTHTGGRFAPSTQVRVLSTHHPRTDERDHEGAVHEDEYDGEGYGGVAEDEPGPRETASCFA